VRHRISRELFYRGVRGRLLTDLSAYLRRQLDAGCHRAHGGSGSRGAVRHGDHDLWARHRLHDPEPPAVDDAGARDTAITLVVHALGSESASRE